MGMCFASINMALEDWNYQNNLNVENNVSLYCSFH